MGWQGAWPPQDVSQSRSRLLELRRVVDSFDGEDGAHSAMGRFLVVRSCGHIEYTFDACLADFAERSSHPAIASHVRGGLFRGRNPRPDDLVDRMTRMRPAWGASLASFMDENDGRLRRELSLLVDRRNSISHGQNEGIGVRKALDLSDMAIEVGDWVSDQLDPTV